MQIQATYHAIAEQADSTFQNGRLAEDDGHVTRPNGFKVRFAGHWRGRKHVHDFHQVRFVIWWLFTSQFVRVLDQDFCVVIFR